MATVPEANRILWEALDAIYATQLEAAQRARDAIEEIAARHPEIAHDPLARDALRAAGERQDGMRRYAESQVGLAETMKSHWERRAAADGGEAEPVPLVRKHGANPLLTAAMSHREKSKATIVD